jgi:two-component system phosphate regulon sensor histidine kinase PhoR
MSEALVRARRVVLVGAGVLVLVLAALAAAGWRLVDVDRTSVARVERSTASQAATDLIRALAATVDHERPSPAVLRQDGSLLYPEPPDRFAPMPPLEDAENALLIRESEGWSPELRRFALQRAARSRDAATSVLAAATGLRLDLRKNMNLASGASWVRLAMPLDARGRGDDFLFDAPIRDVREAVLLRMVPPPHDRGAWIHEVKPAALRFVGGADDVEAASMIAAMVDNGAAIVQRRRAELREGLELMNTWRRAQEVDGAARVAMSAAGDAVVARRVSDHWYVVRMSAATVNELAEHVLSPRSLKLVLADATTPSSAVRFPVDGLWAIESSVAEFQTRSRSTLLLSGLGVAGLAAVGAFAAFAVAVRRDARLSTLRTEFVATVSHELRTPVAVVRTSAETLAAGRATRLEDQRALTAAIVRESERLSTLVGNVLDFARMESGRRTYAKRPTDLGALVRDVAARHPGVAVEVADEVSLACDADALGAAVGNLLDNARKYSSPDAPVVARGARAGGEAVVEVIDRGIGVPDKEKPHVFERFFRGNEPLVRETRGAGIGLALVKHAVESHGGRVEALDTPGGGATFRATLPIGEDG